MEIQNKRSEITKLIENIKRHSDYLNELETIPVLEIGVILSKINKLHEEAAVLKYLCEMQQGKRVRLQSDDFIVTSLTEEQDDLQKESNDSISTDSNENLEEDALLQAKEDNSSEAIEQMFEATSEPLDDSIENEASSNFFAERKSESQIESQEPKESESAEVIEEASEEEAIEPEMNHAVKDQTEEAIGEFESKQELSSKPDINEAFASADSSLSGLLQKQPIADLMSAIGLNERYLYANDLFEGDMQEFKNAIKMLNEFESGEEAKAFFDSGLRSTYNWEDDNTLAQALFNLVERRYL